MIRVCWKGQQAKVAVSRRIKTSSRKTEEALWSGHARGFPRHRQLKVRTKILFTISDPAKHCAKLVPDTGPCERRFS